MYTSTFTFAPGEYDDDFHALDATIAQVARAIPGYLGEETWENPGTGQVSNVYYWATLDALQSLIHHPSHRQAKQQQDRWLRGYQVVIAEVIGAYGDGRIAHPLAGIAVRKSSASPCASTPGCSDEGPAGDLTGGLTGDLTGNPSRRSPGDPS